MQIQVNFTVPIRGMPLARLRDLLIGVVPLMPIRYTDALHLVAEQKLILSSKGEPLKKSSFYHHWSALRLLGFIHQEIDSPLYSIAPRGKRLLEISSPESIDLTEEEQIVFREGMLNSKEIWESFLFLFTGDAAPTENPTLGGMVAFKPLSSSQRTYSIYSERLNQTVITDQRGYQLIITGLRQWGKQCALLDEIFPPTTSRAFMGVSSFMYLVNPIEEKRLESTDFTIVLNRYREYGELLFETTIRFVIPEILSHISLREGIRLSKAQNLLLNWVRQNPMVAALERPSIRLIDNQRGTRMKARVEESQPWLVRDGYIYTTLFVNVRALDELR